MKKMLLASIVFLSLAQNSHALVFFGSGEIRHDLSKAEIAARLITSFPTVFIQSEAELTDEEKNELVRAEARNLVDGVTTESVLLQKMADKMGVDVRDLAEDILAGK